MQNKPKENQHNDINIKNKALWSIVFIVIAVASVWAVVSQTENFSLESFLEFVKSANPLWLTTSIISMLGFIFFEGFALIVICRSYGYKTTLKDGFIFSASDIYFSAITPSATGGQPASAFFMIKSGMPGTFVTVALVANLVMYTAAIVVLSIFVLLFAPGLLSNFGSVSKILISVGFLMQVALLTFFILLLTKKGIMRALCSGTIKLLGKLKIVRKVDKKLAKMEQTIESYSSHAQMLKGKGKMLWLVFLFNLLQRISQLLVSPLTYLASGGSFTEAIDVFLTQTYVLMGANSIPIPGSMGVTDGLMIDGFENLSIIDPEYLELLSRSISFYMSVLICGVAVLISYFALSVKNKKEK